MPIAGIIEEHLPVRGGLILEAIMRRPIRLHPGESREFTLVAYEVTLDEHGAEIDRARADLTGSTIFFTAATAAGAAENLIEKTSDDPDIEILDQGDDETKGMALLKILSADTEAMAVGAYVYDVWISWLVPLRTVVLVETSPFLIASRVTVVP